MFTGVLHTEIDSVWHEVLSWIEGACKRSNGRYEAEDIRKSLKDRAMQLWLYRDAHSVAAVCVTEILIYPQTKWARIIIGTGRSRKSWQDYRIIIEQWAKSQGCAGVETVCRKGWASVFTDYKQSHVFLEKGFI